VATCETFRGECDGPALSDDCPSCISGQKDCPTSGDLECYKDYCCHGTIIKRYWDIEVEECNANCLDFPACAWWSFYNDFKKCYLMDARGEPTAYEDGICTSGQQGCPPKTEPVCGLPLCCDGEKIAIYSTAGPDECLAKCQVYETPRRCEWFTFINKTNDCSLQDSCPNPFPGDCISGENECTNIGNFFDVKTSDRPKPEYRQEPEPNRN